MGDLPRRVPGAARGQFGLFQQHHLRPPAFVRQVIGQTHPHDATADDDHTGVAGKGFVGHRAVFLTLRVVIFSRQANRTYVPSSIMNGTNVSSQVLERLTEEWDALTPEAQKAARYVLENPRDVGVSTVREIAEAAKVKPNTVVRMARQVGFEGYEDFRAPFREAIRRGAVNFPDRARWLQDIRKSGDLGGLYADMVGAAIRNIEDTFAGISADRAERRGRGDLGVALCLYAGRRREQRQCPQLHLSGLAPA